MSTFKIGASTIVLALVSCAGSDGEPREQDLEATTQSLVQATFPFNCGPYTIHKTILNGKAGYHVTLKGDNSGFIVPADIYDLPAKGTCSITLPPPSRWFGHPDAASGSANFVIGCQDQPNNIVGSIGTDVICTGPFNDVVRGNGSSDFINGGPGADDIRGGMGRDYIHGGKGPDTLYGDKDYDCVFGGNDNDPVISGGDQADICQRGADGGNVLNDCESIDQPNQESKCEFRFMDSWNRDYLRP